MILLNINKMPNAKGDVSLGLNDFKRPVDAYREDLNLGCGPMHNCCDVMQVTSPSVCVFPTPSISECINVSGFTNTLDTIFTQDDGI